MVVVVLSTYAFLYTRVQAQKDIRNIWVPPKPKPTLPFGLGPAPEPITPKDFELTNYKDYEMKLIKEAVQSVVMSGGISFLMSMKFGPMSLLIQSIMIPVNLVENVLVRKYIMGITKAADGGNLYSEHFKAPTVESIAIAEKLAIARAAGVGSSATAIADNEPRVVELNDSDSAVEKEEPKVKDSTSDAGADLD